jgi:MFS family permease
VVAAGLILEALGAGIGLTGVTAPHFWATLFVIGVGWNLAFVGASALVLETHQPNERTKVQAVNDFIIFGLMALGSFASGQLLADYGWATVNLAVFPPVLLGLIVLAVTGWSKIRRRAALAATELSDRGV